MKRSHERHPVQSAVSRETPLSVHSLRRYHGYLHHSNHANSVIRQVDAVARGCACESSPAQAVLTDSWRAVIVVVCTHQEHPIRIISRAEQHLCQQLNASKGCFFEVHVFRSLPIGHVVGEFAVLDRCRCLTDRTIFLSSRVHDWCCDTWNLEVLGLIRLHHVACRSKEKRVDAMSSSVMQCMTTLTRDWSVGPGSRNWSSEIGRQFRGEDRRSRW